MIQFFKLFCFCLVLLSHSDSYSHRLFIGNHNFVNLSCQELMLGLINESSFNKKFHDKKLMLEFYFERADQRIIMLKFVKRAGEDKDGIYANFELDLVNRTLKIIDPNPPIPIKINKDYVSFIKDKCTPDENVYGNTGRLPDSKLDG